MTVRLCRLTSIRPAWTRVRCKPYAISMLLPMISIFMMKEYALKSNARRRYHRDSTLSKAGIMLIMILLHDSDHPCLKHFHQEKMCEHMSAMLQALPHFVLKESYSDCLFSMERNMPLPWQGSFTMSVNSLANIPSDKPSGNWLEQKHSCWRRIARSKCVGTSKAMLTKEYSNNFGTTYVRLSDTKPIGGAKLSNIC